MWHEGRPSQRAEDRAEAAERDGTLCLTGDGGEA